MNTIALSPSPSRDLGSISAEDHLLSVASPSFPEAAPSLALLAGRPWVAAGVVAAWAASGVLIAVILGRRGHEVRSLGALGFVLGPFLLGVARSNLIPREAEAEPIELAAGSRLGGHKRVMVAVLGPPDDVAGALPFLHTLGTELSEVVVIRPIPFESAEEGSWDESTEQAAAVLSQAALFLSELHPRLLLVPGRGDRAIRSFLDRREIDVAIAVGAPADLAGVCREVGAGSRTVVFASSDDLGHSPTSR